MAKEASGGGGGGGGGDASAKFHCCSFRWQCVPKLSFKKIKKKVWGERTLNFDYDSLHEGGALLHFIRGGLNHTDFGTVFSNETGMRCHGGRIHARDVTRDGSKALPRIHGQRARAPPSKPKRSMNDRSYSFTYFRERLFSTRGSN